ncbi:MAG: NAD(P)H-binding protein [Alphaproteobacteria bacterium]|nr:NAD(P)H-binding protein [Alphaproteobacteria bacterium]
MSVAVVGATSKTGRYLVARLIADGRDVVAIGRDPDRLAALDPKAEARRGDLTQPETMRAALAGAGQVISLAHARFTAALLETLPDTCDRVVLTGSMRRFTKLPDPAGEAVAVGEAAFAASGRPGVMLHPGLIYGPPEERNVNRIFRYVKRWPNGAPVPFPLPAGGRATIQPIFIDDLIEAFIGALTRAEALGNPVVVGGPEPIAYRDFVVACAHALGRRALIIPLPVGLIAALGSLARAVGLRAAPSRAELLRMTEDKAFDVTPMRERLGVTPRSFEDGLALKMERGWG